MGLFGRSFGGKRKPVAIELLATGSTAPPPPMGALFAALIESAPEKYALIHLLVETRSVDGKLSVLFTHDYPISPEISEGYTIQVSDEISTGAFTVLQAFMQQYGEKFPGFEILLEKTAKWTARFHILGQDTAKWASTRRDLQQSSPVKSARLSWVKGEPQLTMQGTSNMAEVLQLSEGPLVDQW